MKEIFDKADSIEKEVTDYRWSICWEFQSFLEYIKSFISSFEKRSYLWKFIIIILMLFLVYEWINWWLFITEPYSIYRCEKTENLSEKSRKYCGKLQYSFRNRFFEYELPDSNMPYYFSETYRIWNDTLLSLITNQEERRLNESRLLDEDSWFDMSWVDVLQGKIGNEFWETAYWVVEFRISDAWWMNKRRIYFELDGNKIGYRDTHWVKYIFAAKLTRKIVFCDNWKIIKSIFDDCWTQ